jgi:hypothetical protein
VMVTTCVTLTSKSSINISDGKTLTKRPLNPRGGRLPLALAGLGTNEFEDDAFSATAVAALFILGAMRCAAAAARFRGRAAAAAAVCRGGQLDADGGIKPKKNIKRENSSECERPVHT